MFFFLVVGSALVAAGGDYPNLHIVLDTSTCVLSGVLAVLFWEMGSRLRLPFEAWIALGFSATAVLELIHVLVVVEWSGMLAPVTQARDILRPTTWPLAAHVLPTGIGIALGLRHGTKRNWIWALLLFGFAALLYPVFRWLPPYVQPTWLGITRPSLEMVPLLWAVVGVAAWRLRERDRFMPTLARLAAFLFFAHATMLFSRSPHDAIAMVAHLGKVCGYLVLLFSMMRIAALDMRARSGAEAELREVNDELERRVQARTLALAEANEHLRTSEARMAGIVNSAMDAIVSVNADQVIVMFNAAAEKMFRCPASVALGQPLARFIPQRFREQHCEHVGNFGRTGVTSRSTRALGALSGLRADGEEFPIEASISQLELDGQKIFTVILRDVTERKRAEVAAAQLAAIVESSDDAIVGKSLTGIVTTWNAGAERLFGYPASEMIGQPIARLIPEDRQQEETIILERIARGESTRSFETRRRRKDGSMIDVSVTVSAVRDATGNIIGASKTARDISERKRADAALRQKEALLHESDRRLAEIVHGMTEACFALDTEWRFTFVNERGGILLRHSREEMLGRSIWEVFDKLVGTPMEANYRRAMTQRVPVAFEAFSPIAERWLDIRLFPTGEGLAAFLLDISERKKTEESVRLSELKFARAFANNPAAIALTRLEDGVVLDVNDTWVALCGYTREEAVGRSARHMWPTPEEAARFVAELQARGVVQNWEQTFRRKGGETFVAQLSSQILVLGDDRLLLSTLVDVTARKRAEESLRESEERLQVVIENLTEGLVISDLNGRLLHWNRAGLEMHGFQSVEEGRRRLPEFAQLFDLRSLEGRELMLEEWPLPRIIRGEVLRDFEVDIRRRDIAWERIFSYGGAIVRESSGRQIAFLTITDITERKRGEQALRARDVAEAANRMKSEFLATMSHELRTPLNGILGFTELLNDEKPGPLNLKQKQYAGQVLNSGRHLLQLINDILDLAKVEAGRMDVHWETFPLADAIEEVCASTAPLAEKKAIQLQRETAGAPRLVSLDRKKTKQVLFNLLSNAIKFTPVGGRVTVTAESDAREARIRVKDTGIGIKADDLGRLFVEFQQIASGENRRQQGTGLGLALTKRLVELQGGRVAVASTVGVGSTFTIIFPLQPLAVKP